MRAWDCKLTTWASPANAWWWPLSLNCGTRTR